MHTERPKVGVGVYILNERQELLLLKCQGAHGSATWCPPGGHLEFGETFADCAKREASEETSLDISGAELIGVTNDIFREENKHYITLSMRVMGY